MRHTPHAPLPHRCNRIAVCAALCALVAACQTPGTPAAEATATAPAAVTPQLAHQAQQQAVAAESLLQLGRADEARASLTQALAVDPNNKLAQNLMRQITGDPVVLLGKESYGYALQPNETLSTLAARHLNDPHAFYLLARYNGIAVPQQVGAGQVVRIPGKPRAEMRPVPSATAQSLTAASKVGEAWPAPMLLPEPTDGDRAMRSAELAERSGNLDQALAEYRRAKGLQRTQTGATARADQLRQQLASRYAVRAQTAYLAYDLDGAVVAWDTVLELDAGNDTARAERRKVAELRDRTRR